MLVNDWGADSNHNPSLNPSRALFPPSRECKRVRGRPQTPGLDELVLHLDAVGPDGGSGLEPPRDTVWGSADAPRGGRASFLRGHNSARGSAAVTYVYCTEMEDQFRMIGSDQGHRSRSGHFCRYQ